MQVATSKRQARRPYIHVDESMQSGKARQSPRILLQQQNHLGRGKRDKKKAQVFSPTTSKRVKRNGSVKNASERTKWEQFETRITRQIRNIHYYETYVRTYEAEGWRSTNNEKLKPSGEIETAKRKILKAKATIRSILAQVQEQNSNDEQVKELIDPEDPEEIDVALLYCSRCKIGDDIEDNDILICDHEGCHRAYHQTCQDPVIRLEDIPGGDDDWFCHQCKCTINCLGLINEATNNSFDTIDEVFPQPKALSETTAEQQDPYASEEDDDYEPSSSESDDETHEEVTTDELLYHEEQDILCPETRVMRSVMKTRPVAIPDEFRAHGVSDIGRRVARLVPEEGLCFGKVLKFEYAENNSSEVTEEDSWFIQYDDGDDEEIGKQEIEEAFQLAKREEWYDKIVNAEEEENPETLIVPGKRRRAEIDYKSLNEALFGDQGEEDLSADREYKLHAKDTDSEESSDDTSEDD